MKTELNEYAIRRLDDTSNGSYGWMVHLVRAKQSYIKFFADGQWGGKRKAYEAAVAHRDKLDQEIPRPSRAAIVGKVRKNNTSGFPGVTRQEYFDARGNLYQCWVAQWVPNPGDRPKSRKFSIARYGETKAKMLAIEVRKQALKKMEHEPYTVSRTGRRTPPPLPPRIEKVRIDFYLAKDLAIWLEQQAETHEISRSELLSEFIAAVYANASSSDASKLRKPRNSR